MARTSLSTAMRDERAATRAPGPIPRVSVAAWAVGIALAAAAILRLWQVLPLVENRFAFGWDAARRAVLDMRAGDALRGGRALDFLWYVAGPETWPTLRLVPASIAHAVAGPRHAFLVEHAVSIAIFGALALAVAYAARALAPERPALVALLATVLLAGNGALLVHASNGMLEPLSAALTAAAAASWIAARDAGNPRPWALAVLGNLLFHAKWQHGLLLALAVLLLEVAAPGERRSIVEGVRGVLRALLAATRTALGRGLLAAGAVLAALAGWIAATGGTSARVGGLSVGLRTLHGPVAYGVLAAFLFVALAFWRARAELRRSLPARVRFAWAWLVTPMAAWLLVPGTWRLRTVLVTSGTYDSGEALSGWRDRLAFYPEAAWRSWVAPEVRPLATLLLAASLLALVLSGALRRRLLPVAALVAVEWALLAFGTRHNFQARFALNLAPVLAVALCAWLAPLPSRWWTAALAAGLLVALAVPSLAGWRTVPLALRVSQGFEPAEDGAACRALMERLPVERFALVNEAPLSHRQGCALWATAIARQRGERPRSGGIVVVTDARDPEPRPLGYRKRGEVRAGPLRGGVYEKVR